MVSGETEACTQELAESLSNARDATAQARREEPKLQRERRLCEDCRVVAFIEPYCLRWVHIFVACFGEIENDWGLSYGCVYN